MKKLTRSQWHDLDIQFSRTPSLSDGFMASGEHYQLVSLLNSFGIRPNGREEAMKMAENLLVQGWKDET
jgi:hypothetical protein